MPRGCGRRATRFMDHLAAPAPTPPPPPTTPWIWLDHSGVGPSLEAPPPSLPTPAPRPAGCTALIEVAFLGGLPVVCAVCRNQQEASYPILLSAQWTLKDVYSEVKDVVERDCRRTPIRPLTS